MAADIPHLEHERITCSVQASQKYNLDPIILLAVASVENGKPGQWVKNKNGTHDVGAMQLNTAYISTLKKYGITAQDVARPGCYSYYIAAWRIKKHIVYDKQGDIWTRVSNYHSYTPKFNRIYRQKILAQAEKWKIKLSNYNSKKLLVLNTNTKKTDLGFESASSANRRMKNSIKLDNNNSKKMPILNTNTRNSSVENETKTSVVWQSNNPKIY